ncbi:MAG: hypothetical protein ABII82_03605 [Verrucomicrobiota bacterium]
MKHIRSSIGYLVLSALFAGASFASELVGTWVSSDSTMKWKLESDGSGALIKESVNGNPGTLYTHLAWSSDDQADTITYQVKRIELKGSGGYDKSEPAKSDKKYTVSYTLSGNRWTIGGNTYVRQ